MVRVDGFAPAVGVVDGGALEDADGAVLGEAVAAGGVDAVVVAREAVAFRTTAIGSPSASGP